MWWLSARVWAAAIAVLGLSNSESLGACTTNDITSITVSGTGLASYNPFVASTPRQLTINVASNVACLVELAFQTSATPARLQGPGTPLTYDVQLPSTTTSLLFAAGMPTTTTRIDIGAGNVGTATVQVALPTNQIVASGAYNDANLVAHIYDKSTTTLVPLKSVGVPISTTVVAACQFLTPTNPTINFSGAIINGLPNPGHVGSVALSSLNCTAPSRVSLSAGPMLLTTGATGGPAFDSRIHFRATATLAGASTLLDTSTGATTVVSTETNVTSGATLNSAVQVDVRLVRGNPLLAGAYSSVMTVSVVPNP